MNQKKLFRVRSRLFLFSAIASSFFIPASNADDNDQIEFQELNFSLGPVYEQLTEKLLFGELHTGIGGRGSIGFVWHQPKRRHEISLWSHYTGLTNPEEWSARSLNTGIAYRYAQQVYGSSDNRWRWQIGPQFAAKYSIQFFEQLDISHGYWLTRYDVAVNNWLRYAISDRIHWHSMIAIPVLGIMSRPTYRRDYNGDRPELGYAMKLIHQSPTFSSLNNYYELQFETGIQFDFDDRWSEIFSYQFDYNETNLPIRRKQLDQCLLITIQYRF